MTNCSNIADQLFPACQKEANRADTAAQSVSQVSFVRQSRGWQQKLQISKSPDKSSKATRICFAAAAVRSAISLGRFCEILPRLTVIGRMVVIDLGVNVCASLSPSSHHSPSNYPLNSFPLLRILPPPPSPRNPRVCTGGSARRLPVRRVPYSRCCRSSKDASTLLAPPPGPGLNRCNNKKDSTDQKMISFNYNVEVKFVSIGCLHPLLAPGAQESTVAALALGFYQISNATFVQNSLRRLWKQLAPEVDD